jgi:hypothetical protein
MTNLKLLLRSKAQRKLSQKLRLVFGTRRSVVDAIQNNWKWLMGCTQERSIANRDVYARVYISPFRLTTHHNLKNQIDHLGRTGSTHMSKELLECRFPHLHPRD